MEEGRDTCDKNPILFIFLTAPLLPLTPFTPRMTSRDDFSLKLSRHSVVFQWPGYPDQTLVLEGGWYKQQTCPENKNKTNLGVSIFISIHIKHWHDHPVHLIHNVGDRWVFAILAKHLLVKNIESRNAHV